ncbi:MAG: hypothetical protein QGD94_05060 [Planctomycetia bacterium]|nr:hypothetical protein [Planctomycetia bacterium]
MGWSASFPTTRWAVPDTSLVVNQINAALDERDGLVPVGFFPGPFSRWDPMLGVPKGGSPANPTMANFQHQIQEMLTLTWGFRWWDMGRSELYTLANLCQDAFGENGWTYDLTAGTVQNPSMPWTPPYAVFFDELYRAINALDHIRVLSSLIDIQKVDSVYRLTYGISNWAADRAATFALFDGQDDGVTSSLSFDVGLGAEVIDYGAMQEWYLENRKAVLDFNTGGLSGYTVAAAWLDVETAAPAGSADYTDTFTAEVVAGGNQRGTFASDDYQVHRITLQPGDINTTGQTQITVRSTRANTADRTAWAPAGPDYTSTYREGFDIGQTVRLIIKVDFEYQG